MLELDEESIYTYLSKGGFPQFIMQDVMKGL